MKSGLDYFPLDVCLDEKWDLLEAECGLKGFAVVVKLLQKIYGQHGYYCKWTNEVALLFRKQYGLSGNAVSEIVDASIRRGIFDKTLYSKYRILTSRGIQKRYLKAADRRKNVEIKKQYLLYNDAQNFKNVNIISENEYISSKNDGISKQSRVKESRVKESRVEESNRKRTFPPSTPPITQEYLIELYGKSLTDTYIAKAKKYNCIGNIGLIKAAEWLAADVASGKIKLKQRRETSFDLDEYEDMAMNFVPKYSGGQDEN